MVNARRYNSKLWRILASGITLLGLLLTVAGCGKKPPTILGFQPSHPIVGANDEICITVNFAPNDYNVRSFIWHAEKGEILGDGPTITYRAPGVPDTYNISVQLQYADGIVEGSAIVKVVPASAVASSEATSTPTSTNIPTPIAIDTPTPTLVPTPTDTPTEFIPSIDRIEILMDDSPLDLDNPPKLTSGTTVVLEIIAVDSNGKRYASDDLVCKWSVTPIGTNDRDIITDLCKTFYTPSSEYPGQTIDVEVQGLEQHFESSYHISLKLDITP
jgi:hypothetical protein